MRDWSICISGGMIQILVALNPKDDMLPSKSHLIHFHFRIPSLFLIQPVGYQHQDTIPQALKCRQDTGTPQIFNMMVAILFNSIFLVTK